MKKYDYIIVGGGPTGLTLSYLLSKYNKKVGIIEKDDNIGGCHSVKRINGLFSEHGPRIYLGNYIMFSELLKDMGYNFTDLFSVYKFGKTDIFSEVFKKLTLRELLIFSRAFLTLNDSYKKMSLQDFLDKNNFSPIAQDFMDRIGRLTDGGGADKYTLFSFIQIMNQNLLYNIYQPKKPNDIGLFKIWENALVKNNVDIYLNHQINNFIIEDNLIKSVITDKETFLCDKIIFAMPPYSISQFIKKIGMPNIFGNNFNKWSEDTNYITYIPIAFHWRNKLDLKRIWGYPQTSWGVGSIVMSDYMDFSDERSKTVISAIITKQEKSDLLKKTPDEVQDKDVLVKEVFRQLNSVYKNLPIPSHIIMSQNYHNGEKWVPIHTAFMTTKYGYVDFRSPVINNLYNCGVQNGKSSYSFTSMESSVVNAITLIHELIPESKKEWKIKNATTLRSVMLIIILFLFVIFFIFNRR